MIEKVSFIRLRKAVGEAVAAVFVLLLVSLLFAFTILNMPRQPQVSVRSVISDLERMVGESLQLVLINESAWVVLNVGSYDTSVENIVILGNDGSLRILEPVNQVEFGYRNVSSCVIKPSRYLRVGESANILCVGGSLAGLITTAGRIITMDPKLYVKIVTSESINQTILLESRVVENLITYLEDASLLLPGSNAIKTYNLGLGLIDRRSDASIDLEINSSYVFIARSPDGKWNLLITGQDSLGSTRYVEINGKRYSISTSGYYKRYRIVVYGYEGSVVLGGNLVVSPTMFRCSSSLCILRLSGSAKLISFYANVDGVTTTPGFEPYVLTGDIRGSGFMSLVFTTIDSKSSGNKNTYNDRNRYGNLLDYTQTPLRLVFWDFEINNTKYSLAVLSVKFTFLDNSDVDIDEADNRIIVRFGLYDAQNRVWVYKYDLSYYELCRYEGSSITKDLILRIPTPAEVGPKIYYVALELLDPYYYDGYMNDLDVTFILEYLGIVLGVRR
ncbi:MAG: hypothetical protein QN229_03340 [Desulfurococcaceae archaeon TW002]